MITWAFWVVGRTVLSHGSLDKFICLEIHTKETVSPRSTNWSQLQSDAYLPLFLRQSWMYIMLVLSLFQLLPALFE